MANRVRGDILVTMKRGGRHWTNKATGKREEILTVTADGKSALRGMCFKYFTRLAGIRFKEGQKRYFILREIEASEVER